MSKPLEINCVISPLEIDTENNGRIFFSSYLRNFSKNLSPRIRSQINVLLYGKNRERIIAIRSVVYSKLYREQG